MEQALVDFTQNNTNFNNPVAWLEDTVVLQDDEFELIRELLHKLVGVALSIDKKMMVTGRLRHRINHYGLSSYYEYYQLVNAPHGLSELQVMINALTTNETYFFREPTHFDYLQNTLIPNHANKPFRCWSAACSSGEETYSIAMSLAHTMKQQPWEVMGSDINSKVLKKAQSGLYPMVRHEGISQQFLKQYCLKGTGSHHGTFLINPALRKHVFFKQINLMETLPDIGTFDLIFLRNVLIYFDQHTKQTIVRRVLEQLKPGGFFIISHTESLQGLKLDLEMLQPSIFRKQ